MGSDISPYVSNVLRYWIFYPVDRHICKSTDILIDRSTKVDALIVIAPAKKEDDSIGPCRHKCITSEFSDSDDIEVFEYHLS